MLDRRYLPGIGWPIVGIVFVVLGACVLSACGDSGDSAGTDAASGAQAEIDKAREQADFYYEGTYQTPPTSGPAPAQGKHVFIISSGNGALGTKSIADGFAEGAEKIGWDTTLVDAKFDPNNALLGIRQAVAAGADGIFLDIQDCAPVQAALQEAKDAKIPVVATEALDCDETDPDAPSLFTWQTRYTEGTYVDWVKAWGKVQAAYTIAQTNGEAKVLSFVETDLLVTKFIGESFEQALTEGCATCEILERVNFTGNDLGPELQQKVEEALLKHPDANVVYGNYDQPIVSGIDAAVRSQSRDVLVIGGEGYPANIELVREGRQSMGVGYVLGWEGYNAVDAFVRLFAGQQPSKETGFGVQLFDADHNMPSPEEAKDGFQVPIDWRSAYEQAWGVK